MHCTTINNNRPITIQQPTKPNSSPTIAKIKSDLWLRNKISVLHGCGCIIIQSFTSKLSGTNRHNWHYSAGKLHHLHISAVPAMPEYAFADNRAEMADLAVQQY